MKKFAAPREPHFTLVNMLNINEANCIFYFYFVFYFLAALSNIHP